MMKFRNKGFVKIEINLAKNKKKLRFFEAKKNRKYVCRMEKPKAQAYERMKANWKRKKENLNRRKRKIVLAFLDRQVRKGPQIHEIEVFGKSILWKSDSISQN